MRHAQGLIIGLLSLGPMACSGGGGGGGGEGSGTVVGTLLDARSGQPVGAATVRLGSREVRSNEQGYFTLDSLPAGEDLLLVIEHPDRPRSVRPITVRSGASTYVRWQLLAFEASQTFDAASGGAVEARGARVSFGPGVIDAAGAVTARLAYLDATQPAELAAFPGDFRTDRGGQLESFGAVAVTPCFAASRAPTATRCTTSRASRPSTETRSRSTCCCPMGAAAPTARRWASPIWSGWWGI